jgi:hypothetical protein
MAAGSTKIFNIMMEEMMGADDPGGGLWDRYGA